MSTSTEDRHKKLLALRDEDIDYSDIPERDDDFWAKAKVVMPRPRNKSQSRLTARCWSISAKMAPAIKRG